MATVRVLNSLQETASFPIDQSIKLSCDVSISNNQLKDKIVLFRLQTEDKLINLASPYAYTLGYIKEKFDVVPLKYEVVDVDNVSYITCTPISLLNPNSKYCLYVTKQITENLIRVSKIISKSNSNIEVEGFSNLEATLTVNIASTTKFSNGTKYTVIELQGNEYRLDLSSKNKINIDGITIRFISDVYVEGESFSITVSPATELDTDLQYTIETARSDSITSITNQESSTVLNTNDILNYYQTLSNVADTIIEVPNYLDNNVFSIKVEEGYEIDIDSIQYTLGTAFNNYLLKQLGLYDNELKYKLYIEKDLFENEYIFTLLYTDDIDQTSKLVIINV